MYAFTQVAIGLAIAHLMWGYFYVCGSLVRTPKLAPGYDPRRLEAGSAALDIVITTATGMAVTGFVAFVAGMAHAMYPVTAIVWVIVLGALLAYLGDSPLRGSFWSTRFAVLRTAATWPFLLVYAAALLAAVPAALPDTGSDATSYHWAYALDWANAHRITVDYWLRLPYYALNWVLLDAWTIELGANDYLNFLTWLTGCLSLLGMYGFVVALAPLNSDRRLVVAVSLLAPLSLLLSPTFLAWANTGFVDVPIGLFFFVFFACVVAAVRMKTRYLLSNALLCGAFFIGMKISLIAFLPLAVVALAYAATAVSIPPRRTLLMLAALVCLSLPWYVSNFVQAGDPISPTLNIAIRGADPKFSKADAADVVGNLKVGATPSEFVRLPLEIVTQTTSMAFRAPGVTWLLLLVGLPSAIVVFVLLARRGKGFQVFLEAAMLAYAIGYWMETSALARYALVFYASLGAAAALYALLIAKRAPRYRWAAAIAVALFAVPSPGSAAWLGWLWQNNYVGIWSAYTQREAWLQTHSPAYPEIEYASSALVRSHKSDLRVYALELEYTHYFFKEFGVDSIGDWYGPERYVDFRSAIQNGQLAAYVDRFRIGAFIVPLNEALIPDAIRAPYPEDLIRFDEEAAKIGFSKHWDPQWRYIVYLGAGVK